MWLWLWLCCSEGLAMGFGYVGVWFRRCVAVSECVVKVVIMAVGGR